MYFCQNNFCFLPKKKQFFSLAVQRPAVITEMMWLEECNDLIRSCGQLSTLLGIQKSFSTSDIAQIPGEKHFDYSSNGLRNSNNGGTNQNAQMRHAISELALNSIQRCGYMLETRLDHTSRSCSTWVAVGELASTSQLPSPHGGYTGTSLSVNQSSSQQQLTASTNFSGNTSNSAVLTQPPFTAADLIRSVNKKVRENYIRSRLLTTYRAIERLSQSEFNLDQLATVASTTLPSLAISSPGPTELVVPSISTVEPTANTNTIVVATNESSDLTNEITDESNQIQQLNTVTVNERPVTPTTIAANSLPKKKNVSLICPQLKTKVIAANMNRNLTIHDIEKERGRPLSKYDRNMMIFNWLHSLDETSTAEEYN